LPTTGPETCPTCSYNLTGLPCPHTCPECGSPYDEFTRTWRPRKPWKIYLSLIGASLIVADKTLKFAQQRLVRRHTRFFGSVHQSRATAQEQWHTGTRNSECVGPLDRFETILWMLFLFFSVGIIMMMALANRRGRLIAVTPRGLLVRNLRTRKLIPWSDLTDLRAQGKRVRITQASKILPFDVSNIFESKGDVIAFCSHALDCRDRYSGLTSEAQTPPPPACSSDRGAAV